MEEDEKKLHVTLTLLMLRLLMSKAQERKDFCCVGIHWIALAEYSQLSTHVPGFLASF